MQWYEILLLILLALFVILLAVILIRALLFNDKTIYVKETDFKYEDDEIVSKLGKMIKIPTISHPDEADIDFEKFDSLVSLVQKLYPTVFSVCEFTHTEERAIKLKLKGHSSEKPTVLMAHYDVVPVTDDWKYDPFLGEVVEGNKLYGRGAVDTKSTMACALSALELALKKGYKPKNDLYLCFGSNEEVYGNSQVKIIEEFERLGIRPHFVFDEGGAILNGAFPGVKEDTAFLGMGEKAMVNIKLSLESNGGHSSTPRKNGPAVRLARAIVKLEENPMKPNMSATVNELLNVLGRHMPFYFKIIFANMWLFKGLVKKLFVILSADTRALLTSTFAFTMLNGGNQTNILPNKVEANINVRISPFDNVDSIIEHIKKVINDKDIMVTAVDETPAFPECSFKTEGFEIIKETVIETYPNTVVAPFLNIGGSDGKHWTRVSDCVIRFSPFKVSKEERAGIHGVDEHIKVQTLHKCLEFYERLLEKI